MGVGSLPHVDPERALDLVAATTPRLPFWPQLPRRGPGEGMIAQVAAEGPRPRPALEPDRAAGFFAFERAVEAGRFPRAEALKGQLVGPSTLARWLEGGAERLPALTEHLAALAAWQARRLARFGLPVLLVLDEPGLPGAPAEALAATRRVLRAIEAEGAQAGLHCCDKFDLALLSYLEPAVLHFDAHHGLDALLAHEGARAWRLRGGLVAPGLVPATGPCPRPEALRARARAAGPGPWLWSTSCGLAGCTEAQARRRMARVAALAEGGCGRPDD